MSTLTRVVQKVVDEIEKPEGFVKGDEFESFVRTHLFPKEKYIILQKTHDYADNKDDFIESSKEPDFKFRASKSGRDFYVEAKYRSDFYRDAVEWCKPYQLRRYQDINKKTPVCIVIGVGGNAGSPEQVFLIPIKDAIYTKLFCSFLRKFEIQLPDCVDERTLLSLLGN